MRVVLHLTKNSVPISNPRNQMLSLLHKWLGRNNNTHNERSFYTFSDIWGRGSTSENGLLNFPNGGKFVFSSNDTGVIGKILHAIDQNPKFICGMEIINREYVIYNPDIEIGSRFFAQSPIHLTYKPIERDSKNKIVTFRDENSSEVMTRIMKLKMEHAGINSNGFHIAFDLTFPNKRTFLWKHTNDKKLAVNYCPVTINGTNEQKIFCLDVGVGKSTGMGLGCIKPLK